MLRSPHVAPREKPFEITDKRLPGFVLRIQPSGRMSFVVRWRRGGRKTLGAVGILTPAEARDRAERVLGNIAHGRDPDHGLVGIVGGVSLRDFIDDRYADWVQANHADPQTTIERIQRCFREWYDYPITDISTAMLDRWVADRLRQGRAGSTINRDLSVLSGALSKAVTWQLLVTNPVRQVQKCRIDKSPITRYLSRAENERLIETLRKRDLKKRKSRLSANRWRRNRGYPLLPPVGRYCDHLTPMVLLSLNTGCRRGELLSLTWSDVDLERQLLTVSGNRTKNGQSRVVNLNSEAISVFRRWKRQSRGTIVFPNANGKRLGSLKTAWSRVLRDAEIAEFRWHDLRHTFASNLVMADVTLNTVRELLGHGDMSMTLRYAHLSSEHKAEAVEKLCA